MALNLLWQSMGIFYRFTNHPLQFGGYVLGSLGKYLCVDLDGLPALLQAPGSPLVEMWNYDYA